MIAHMIRGGVEVNTRSNCPDIGVVLPFEAAVVVVSSTKRKCFWPTDVHVVFTAWT